MVRRLAEHRERVQILGFAVLVIVALCSSFPYFEQTRNANEIPRLVQAMSMVDAGSFAIDGPVRRRIELGPDVARSPKDRRIYPNKPPGTSVVAAVAYRIARAHRGDALDLRAYTWWARLLTGALPTLLLLWFMVHRLTRSFSSRPALAATCLYAFATPAASYAHLAYGHQLAAALLTVGVVVCIDAVSRAEAHGRMRAMAWALVGGATAGAAVAVEYGAAFAGLPLGVALLMRARRPDALRPTLAAIVGALIPIVLLMLYHRAAFGSAFSTGYHHVISADFAEKHGQGLLGLGWPKAGAFFTHFLSVDAGLLWWAPLFPLGLYGLARASTHDDDPTRTTARVMLATFVLYILITSSLSFEGGWRVGPRYLVAVLPMLAWGWAEALSQIRERAGWIVGVFAVALYATIVNVLAANLWPHFDVTNIHDPVSEVLLPLWTDGAEPYSLLALGFGLRATHLVVGITIVGTALALARTVELTPRTAVAFVAALLAGVALVAATRGFEPHPKGPRNLDYIRRVWEPPADDPRWPRSKPLPALSAEAIRRAQRGPAR